MNWYLKVLRQYADFNGRARRKEYWYFILFNTLFSIIALVLNILFGISYDNIGSGPINLLYGLFLFIPSIAVSVRRLHDIGKSGWWCLLGGIPLIGAIWLFVLFIRDSQPFENKWGKNPKEVEPTV